ncbi:hypothetical protein SAMN04489716_8367 [Actinoplanes derwentensis]|uniref:Uncharacterized protein n=1 Tax=Actinoplanes derwentensis TaxID=113562 RepID=A0A1H2D6Q8_9ACTN|nr:hypothetical protein SAMN04489716_8367 [Actinoplanes derwentensis]
MCSAPPWAASKAIVTSVCVRRVRFSLSDL